MIAAAIYKVSPITPQQQNEDITREREKREKKEKREGPEAVWQFEPSVAAF